MINSQNSLSSNAVQRRLGWQLQGTRTVEIVLAPLVLFGIFWFYLGKFLGGEFSTATWQDNTYLVNPIFSFISRTFASGEFPYWIDSIIGGIPLYSTPQFSILYPLYFFGSDLYRTPLDALIYVYYVTLLHLFIFYLNSYIMLRIFRIPILSSIVGATFLALSRNMNFYKSWVNITASYAWLPLAVGAVYLILENKYPKSGLVLGVVSFTMLTVASPSQALIHIVYCTAFLLVCYCIVNRRNAPGSVSAVRNLTALACLSLLAVAPVLIPAVVLMETSIRWIGPHGSVVGDSPLPFAAFMEGQSPPSEFANVLFPLAKVSSSIGNSYLGLIPASLALLALCKRRMNWIVVPLSLLAAYTLLSAGGSHFGLAYLNYELPFWNKIREPDRHLILFVLASSALSGFGFQLLWEWIRRVSDVAAIRFRTGLVAFLVTFLGAVTVIYKTRTAFSVYILFGAWVLFFLAAVGFRLVPKFNGTGGKIFLAILAIAPTIMISFDVPKVSDGDYFDPKNLRSHGVLREIARIDDIRNYRVRFEDEQLNPQFWSMNASYYDIRTLEAYINPMSFAQFQDLSHASPPREHYGKVLGTKYYLCRSCKNLSEDFKLDREIDGYRLYSTPNALPRVYWSDQIAASYESLNDFLQKVEANDDYLGKIFVSAKDIKLIRSSIPQERRPGKATINRTGATANTLSLSVEADSPGVLVLNEYFSTDWKVTIDGLPRDLLEVNRNQMGVLIPSGRSEVRYQYYPALFLTLVWIRDLVLLLSGCAVLAMVYKQRTAVRLWFSQPVEF